MGPLARVENGEIHIDLEVDDDFAGFDGIVHGGIIATILDEAMGLANTRIHGAQGAVTVRLEISYEGPVRTMQPLTVRARSHPDGRKFDCSSELLERDGKVLATATSLWIVPRVS